MGGGKIDIVLHICMVRKKIVQNYEKKCTYATRTCKNLRKLPFQVIFFTQTTLKGVNFYAYTLRGVNFSTKYIPNERTGMREQIRCKGRGK